MRYSWPELLWRAELADFYRELNPRARCTGDPNAENPEPCTHRPMPGLDWCYVHAGRDANRLLIEFGLRRTAEARGLLLSAAPEAAARLAHIALRGSERSAVTAAQAVLDRVGVRGGVELEATVHHDGDASPLQTLLERLSSIEQRRSALPPPTTHALLPVPAVESVEVVGEDSSAAG